MSALGSVLPLYQLKAPCLSVKCSNSWGSEESSSVKT